MKKDKQLESMVADVIQPRTQDELRKHFQYLVSESKKYQRTISQQLLGAGYELMTTKQFFVDIYLPQIHFMGDDQ